VASASKGFHDVYLDTFRKDNKKTTSIVSTTMCNIGWQFRVSSIYVIYQHSIQLQIGISRIGTDLWLRPKEYIRCFNIYFKYFMERASICHSL
jgi:hypothetical protein